MPSKIKDVNDPQEILNRIAGYADSAKRSAYKTGDPNCAATHTSLGFVRSQLRRYFELVKP